MRTASLACLLLALGACAEPVDAPPIGDYTAAPWKRFDVRGSAPGHGDTYRVIYANSIATDPAPFFGGYPEGSIVVKEIRDDDDGQPGALRYVALMRRLPGMEDEGGWLFSQSETPGGDESYRSLCWGRCHAAAPYNGAWYDYRR